MTTTRDERPAASARFGLIDRLARRVLLGQLQNMRRGRIVVRDDHGSVALGDNGDLQAVVRVQQPRLYRQLMSGGSLSAAAAYFRGDWDCDELSSLFRILVRNQGAARRMDRSTPRLVRAWHRFRHLLRANTRSGSRENVAAHYDLGNDFFSLWLDDTLAYSSGIFACPEFSLRDASTEKFDRVCRKLELKRGDRLVEIGTGWGGLAIHAAANYGCHVTTTTISQQQYEVARRRIRDAGLSGQATLLRQDYRDLSGQFDKLASIEMIEAVGHRHLDVFFRKCSDLLTPDGSAVIQGIVMPDQSYAQYLGSVDFIQRYVFPGGCLPSLGAMVASAARATDLRLAHVEDFGLHYAETLRRWRLAFHERLDEVRRLGYSNEFIRLWTYYLCYCEAAFEERHTSVVQVQFDKPACRRDGLRISRHAAAELAPRSSHRRSRGHCSPHGELLAEVSS
jgi:cyclopropane-fatty-acyl-phospholipid synthase